MKDSGFLNICDKIRSDLLNLMGNLTSIFMKQFQVQYKKKDMKLYVITEIVSLCWNKLKS
jgi:hypothetical protein